MSKVYYSYYNLVRKPNTAFDCLKGIAVFARSGFFDVQINGNFATPQYNVHFYFLPIADVYQGALIRGDKLYNTSTGAFYPLTDLTERPGRYRVRVLSPPATGGVSGRTLTIVDNTRSRFSFDSSACIVSLDATFPVSASSDRLQHRKLKKGRPRLQRRGRPTTNKPVGIGGLLIGYAYYILYAASCNRGLIRNARSPQRSRRHIR